MAEIASYLLREENLEIAVHGSAHQFSDINNHLVNLLESMKKENPRYAEHLDDTKMPEFEVKYRKHFFETTLKVNMCVESMVGPSRKEIEDFGALLIARELLTYGFLLPSIREKGGAYGAGCSLDDSGVISFYSYRDPNIEKTYVNFDQSVKDLLSGAFSE